MKTVCTYTGRFFLLIFITITWFQLPAQDFEKPAAEETTPRFYKWEIGFKVMPMLTYFYMVTWDGAILESKQNTSLARAGVTGYSFNPNMGVQVEVIYNAIDQSYSSKGSNNVIHINYLSVPVLVSVNTDRTRRMSLNFVLGPQIGINLGSVIENSNYSDTIQNIRTVNQSKLGVAYGGGAEFAVNHSRKLRLNTGFRGVSGLINVPDNTQKLAVLSSAYNKLSIHMYSIYVGISCVF